MNGMTREEWARQRAKYEAQGFKHAGLGIMVKQDSGMRLRCYKNSRGELIARLLDWCAVKGRAEP